MDFFLNASDLELAALTRSILAGGRRSGTAADGTAGAAAGLDEGLWADLAKAGVLSAGLPESLDGADAGLLAQCAVLTEIGRAIAPVPYLEAIVLGAGAVARFGLPEQQRRWAERRPRRTAADRRAGRAGQRRPGSSHDDSGAHHSTPSNRRAAG